MSAAQPRSRQEREIDRLVAVGQRSGQADLYGARRQYVRYAVDVPLDACRQSSDNENAWIMSMHDVSLGGIGAWSHAPVELHTTLLVRDASTAIHGQWLRCVVRHCTRGLRGFLIGAQFLQGTTTEEPKQPPPPSSSTLDARQLRKRVKRR